MTKIITLYNHKGGVSKTTTTYHLAYALAEHRGKKVLVVDADPQCNLTELCLSKTIDALDAEEEAGKSTTLPGTSVKDALWPRLDGERVDVDVDAASIGRARRTSRGDRRRVDGGTGRRPSNLARKQGRTPQG